MAASEVQETNLKGEKEHDKLLSRPGNGSFSRPQQGYSDIGGYNGSGANLQNNEDDSSTNTSLTNKDISRRTSKDAHLKKIAEEEPPKADCKRKILKVVVTFLFIVIVVGVVIIWSFHEGQPRKHLGNQYFDFVAKTRVITVYNKADNVVLEGYIRKSDFDLGKAKPCQTESLDGTICFSFDDGAVFKFLPYQLDNTSVNCVNLMWENIQSYRQVPTDCFDVEYGLWFGLPNFKGSFFPLNLSEVSIDEMPYRPYRDKVLGHVLENYWLSTEGIAIIGHQNLPLKVSYNADNSKQLCLSLDFQALQTPSFPNLNYSICHSEDIKQTFTATRNTFFQQTNIIDYKNHDFSKVVWSYESKYPTSGNFGDFLHQLNTADVSINMIYYNSIWEAHPGDLHFDALKKNEISKYLQGKYSATKLMLPVTVACSTSSLHFQEGVDTRLFVQNPQTHAFTTIRYQDNSCALWDASNPDTKQALMDYFDSMQQKGTSEETDFPQAFEFKTTIGNTVFPLKLSANTSDINVMDLEFLNVLLDLDKTIVMETAFRLQNKPVFVHVPTTVSNRDGKKCLDYIISGALTAGIHGYPYIIAEPPPEDKVDKELFIRWLEVAMLYPGLKVTNSALNFGDEAINITKNISSYRENIVIPIYSKIMSDVAKGYPLLRPIWWINPMDYKTLKISDQFLLGTSLMVAPILCHTDRKRDIYIPEGLWVHSKTGTFYEGKKWLKDFEVPLHDIPTFHSYIHPDNTTDQPRNTKI